MSKLCKVNVTMIVVVVGAHVTIPKVWNKVRGTAG